MLVDRLLVFLEGDELGYLELDVFLVLHEEVLQVVMQNLLSEHQGIYYRLKSLVHFFRELFLGGLTALYVRVELV